ncbi:GH-E family nuclease [Nocardia miyunensis]|uniref:GH-E family nuclease n=1 Tax=Nocardia miyunensis TaxID=282684 RepID=UPI000B0C74D9|nr:GH-E family nuclease [Nocardia miyunensis]
MAPIVAVDPEGFTKAAGVYAAVHDDQLVPAITDLCNVLAGCGSSAGSDNAGLAWSKDYDPAAFDTVDALGDLALACGQMHDLLQHTAANYKNANAQSAPDPKPDDLVFPPGSLAVYNPPEPPVTFGGDDPEPTGWDWVKGAVQGEVWPNGDPGKLRKAAQAWRTMRDKLWASTVPQARSFIDAQRSPDTAQALDQHDIVKGQFTALADVCGGLAKSCDAYADSVDSTKKAIIKSLVEMVGLILADQAAGAALAFFTGGSAEAAAQGAMALIIARTGLDIANLIRTLIGLAELSRVPAAVSQAIARGAELLIPLLRAEPALAGPLGTEAGPGSFTAWAKLRRPSLRQGTQDAILAKTKTWGRPGEPEDFYQVDSEPEVKVPINKSYTDKPWVQQLPKTPDGKYYIDTANGSMYPVNPSWEFGHNSGFENRRLLADAQAQNMTQEQLNDYVNTHPDYFHVEDQYGNRSHRREQK